MKTAIYIIVFFAAVAAVCFILPLVLLIILAFIMIFVLAWLGGVPITLTKNDKLIAKYRWFKRID
jgi:hypothetical protein